MTKAEEFREHWGDEMDGAALYRALAERSEGEQREIFLELGAAEGRHAAHWSGKLVGLGAPQPPPATPAARRRPGHPPPRRGRRGPRPHPLRPRFRGQAVDGGRRADPC